MLPSDLKKKWLLISKENIRNNLKLIRLSSSCISEVFLGLDPDGQRCLVLLLPKSYKFDFKSIEKEKISIDLDNQNNYLFLSLLDLDYMDLFDDLIISLYNAIKDIAHIKQYTYVFIQTFNKWSTFFEAKNTDRLTNELIMGLFGELFVLENLLEETNSSMVNAVLKSWKGPYDAGHDFILDHKDIEVKTISISKNHVRISSEMQLEEVYGKGLELLVLSVEQDLVSGLSLKDKFYKIKDLIVGMGGDTVILMRAISQKGLNHNNIHEYDNFKFSVKGEESYDCLMDDFPRITRSNIDKSLMNVKYNLALTNLENFIISKKEF